MCLAYSLERGTTSKKSVHAGQARYVLNLVFCWPGFLTVLYIYGIRNDVCEYFGFGIVLAKT